MGYLAVMTTETQTARRFRDAEEIIEHLRGLGELGPVPRMSQIMNEAGNLELDIIRGDIAQDCGRLESVVELSESVRFDRPEFTETSQVLDDLFGVSKSAGRRRLGGHDSNVIQ